MSELLIVNENTRQKILDCFQKSEKDISEDVGIIRNWLYTQKHLPEIPSTNMIEFFLINNKFGIELTKQKLDMYYSIRSVMPNLFLVINPKQEKMKSALPTSYVFPLPKLVDDMYRITIIKDLDVPFSQLYVEGGMGKILNTHEIRLHEDMSLKNIVIMDCEFFNINNTLALTPMHIKMGITILEKVYSSRVKEVHIINCNYFFNIMLQAAKAFVKQKLLQRIRIHDSLESLQTCIPLEALPKDYGGMLQSLDELQDLWIAKLKQYEDRFDKLDAMKVDESLRPVPMENLDDYGIQGTFKKLSID